MTSENSNVIANKDDQAESIGPATPVSGKSNDAGQKKKDYGIKAGTSTDKHGMNFIYLILHICRHRQ